MTTSPENRKGAPLEPPKKAQIELEYTILGSVQTSHSSYAEYNANEVEQYNLLISIALGACKMRCLMALSYTDVFRLVLHGGGGEEAKYTRPFSLKRIKLQQSNLVH